MKLERKPPVIEAVRWTGTKESSKEVLDFVRGSDVCAEWTVETRLSLAGDEVSMALRIRGRGIPRWEDAKIAASSDVQTRYLSNGDWIVREEGEFSLWSHDELMKRFTIIEEPTPDDKLDELAVFGTAGQ